MLRQNVYPYAYLVRDVGKEGHNLASLLPDTQAVPSKVARRLFLQWSLFWDLTKPVLLEKTPENLLMGPFLQTTFGEQRSKFAFVMRHPLIWALAIEKWVSEDFRALRTVEDRISFWFECMSRTLSQLPALRDALVLHLEAVSASSGMQLDVSRHLLCDSDSIYRIRTNQSRGIKRPPSIAASTSILSSSLAYVSCWLNGMEFKASSRRCTGRRSFRDPSFGARSEQLAAENRLRLHLMSAKYEVQANRFGYTFSPFQRIAALPHASVHQARILGDGPIELAAQLGVSIEPALISSQLRPHLVMPPIHPLPPSPPHHSSGPVLHVLLAYHKMGFDSDKPTGMDIRMGQILQSLVSLHIQIHFLCHCDVNPSQLSPFGRGVTIYSGSLRQQYKQAIAMAPQSHAFIFFTTLTMSVHQRMLQGEAAWNAEPHAPLPEEQLRAWFREDFQESDVCVIAVADDIHYIRVTEVMGRYSPSMAADASVWMRRRELGFYASVDTLITVSEEDSTHLQASLKTTNLNSNRSASTCSACECSITWVPYVVDAVDRATVDPFETRHDGMLYVGGMHGLALIAIEWLLQYVQPAISEQSHRGVAELLPGGLGHLYVAGPGWADHLSEGRILNRSVSLGRVSLLGVLSELQLAQRLQQHKVFAAPVLNGTGIATKNVLAMARGIPLVTTSVGLNGLGLPAEQHAVLVADDPSAFARNIMRVQSSPKEFDASWRAALAHAQNVLSSHRQMEMLCRILRCTATEYSVGSMTKESNADLCSNSRHETGLCTVQDVYQATIQEVHNKTSNSGSRPLVILGLGGTGVRAVSSRLHSQHVCLVQEPLRGIVFASLETQLEYLSSILRDPSLCQVAHMNAHTPRLYPIKPPLRNRC